MDAPPEAPVRRETAERGTINVDETYFTYHNLLIRALPAGQPGPKFSATFALPAVQFYGAWRLGSIGPDRDYYNRPQTILNAAQLCYDPTNGTRSQGNIWRSQARTDSEQPSDPNLLAPHG